MIGNVGGARPSPWDRNPVNRGKNAYANVAPHGATTRWTYTCPTGKKAYLVNAMVGMMRRAVAAPVGVFTVEIDVTCVDATAAQLMVLRSIDNSITKEQNAMIGASAPLVAGELISSFTTDASTGGTVEYISGAWLQEFDA